MKNLEKNKPNPDCIFKDDYAWAQASLDSGASIIGRTLLLTKPLKVEPGSGLIRDCTLTGPGATVVIWGKSSWKVQRVRIEFEGGAVYLHDGGEYTEAEWKQYAHD